MSKEMTSREYQKILARINREPTPKNLSRKGYAALTEKEVDQRLRAYDKAEVVRALDGFTRLAGLIENGDEPADIVEWFEGEELEAVARLAEEAATALETYPNLANLIPDFVAAFEHRRAGRRAYWDPARPLDAGDEENREFLAFLNKNLQENLTRIGRPHARTRGEEDLALWFPEESMSNMLDGAWPFEDRKPNGVAAVVADDDGPLYIRQWSEDDGKLRLQIADPNAPDTLALEA